jgi:hypothetical protein
MRSPAAPFRFRDLPSEIRNKVYRELLCDFKPIPTTFNASTLLDLAPAARDVDTAILCTNTVTYREAYDVMVKTNRFVKVTSVPGLPLRTLLGGIQVPIVTERKKVVNRFRGYVLAIHLGSAKSITIPQEPTAQQMLRPCTLMILHRDMELFCTALSDGDAHVPGYSGNLQISMTVAPILDEPRLAENKPSFESFFSEATQKALLAPFKTHLRGYKAVNIRGHVARSLAADVENDMRQDRWSDPAHILANFALEKEKGLKLFQERMKDEGCLVWQDAALDIDKIVESSSWPTLIKRGGQSFISQLAELYFLVRLNAAHVQLLDMQEGIKPAMFAGIMAEDALNSATKSLRQDHWMVGYKYRPSVQRMARLQYRFALLIRLQAEPGTAERAMTHIDNALRLQPRDMGIIRERDNIVAWLQRGY